LSTTILLHQKKNISAFFVESPLTSGFTLHFMTGRMGIQMDVIALSILLYLLLGKKIGEWFDRLDLHNEGL